jgi:hypothetical protein
MGEGGKFRYDCETIVPNSGSYENPALVFSSISSSCLLQRISNNIKTISNISITNKNAS